ncbi:Fic family protein [Dawidia soli]|uniref:Fic family protein n=1 Tax=Dawidia soli TaxID=2782352 RepID=A0AAP2DAM6_9BACT|nr:Fic/DOC family N-terminal domain-containing protein [Dawidia soli]MBT1688239.1 Fic family protein [Dawidia soli]
MAYDRKEPYNDLPLLPPSPDVENDPYILRKLVSASRALAAMDGHVLRLPNPYMLVNTIALQEAKASTAIENIFTTEDELYKAVSDTVREERANVGTKEVLKYREALWEGHRRLQEDQTITQNLITGIFQQIKNTASGIRSPQAQIIIKQGQSEFRTGEVVYTPPRGEGVVERFLENLLEYLNDDEQYPADPLLKMCVAHYQFEAIHPFADGNGRTGRILNLLYLVNKGLLSKPVLYLSKYIIANKDEYYYNLSAITQRSAWKQWILYMLDAVEQTSLYTNRLIGETVQQMEATLAHGKKHIKWYNKDVNEALFSQPYSRMKTLANVLDRTSRTTLTKYMDELVRAKIVMPKKEGTEVYYINEDLIRILEG